MSEEFNRILVKKEAIEDVTVTEELLETNTDDPNPKVSNYVEAVAITKNLSEKVPDDVETAAGDDTTTSTLQSVIDALSVNKQVPAMGGIGLLALGLSMLGLGAVRLRK